eukprot:1501920-Amphidinium_carterae.1
MHRLLALKSYANAWRLAGGPEAAGGMLASNAKDAIGAALMRSWRWRFQALGDEVEGWSLGTQSKCPATPTLGDISQCGGWCACEWLGRVEVASSVGAGAEIRVYKLLC